MKKTLLLAVPFLLIGCSVQSNDTNTQRSPISPYVGQEERAIKSLSSDDIATLRRGGGWGLAKAAELNGVPGPAHLLEMKDDIPLDESQVSAISEIADQMKAQAIERGETLIALERVLDEHFQAGTITDEILRSSLDAIASTRMELRYIHLATHLRTPEILSPIQIESYRALRGYSEPGQCADMATDIPAEHSAEMEHGHGGGNNC